jgi:hypothetical protein
MSSRRPRVAAYLFIFSFKKKLFVLHFLLDNDCAYVVGSLWSYGEHLYRCMPLGNLFSNIYISTKGKC